MLRRLAPLAAVAAVAVAYALGRHAAAPAASGIPLNAASRPGTPVATFAGQSISAEEIGSRLAVQHPFNRQRFATPEGKKDFLEQIVRLELLALAAAGRGYDKNPEVLTAAKQRMVSKFVEAEFSEAAIRTQLGDDEVRRFYDEHLEDYRRPERIRAALIRLLAPASDPAGRDAKRALIRGILAEVRAKEARDPFAFAAVARAKSEDPETRAVDGDLRFLSRDELAQRWGNEVAAAVFTLRMPGKISDVIESRDALDIVKIQNLDPAVDMPFEQVQETVRSRAAFEKRTRTFEEFVAGLKRTHHLTIDERALAAVGVDLAVPPSAGQSIAMEPPGPAPTPGALVVPVQGPRAEGSP